MLTAVVLTACGGGSPADAAGGAAGTQPAPDQAEISTRVPNASAAPVQAMSADIDDAGAVTVLFTQRVGDRSALLATQSTPGAIGVTPQFSAPEVIDGPAPLAADGDLAVATSPPGNALALWTASSPCTEST